MKRTSLGVLASVGLSFIFFSASPASAQIPLGSAQNFGALAGSTLTNTGPTSVTGNVGVSPGSAVTGFPPGVVVGGTIQAGPASQATAAQADLTTAYNDAVSRPCTLDLTGQNLGGMTLGPGVYCFSTSAGLTGTLTLDFQNNPNAFFLFKIGSTLTTASASQVVLINTAGAACPQQNINFQVGTSATLGTASSFSGNILALSSITLTTGSRLTGRALARNGAVTLDTNAIAPCQPAIVCPVITVNPATLPNGTVGTAFGPATVSATGGTGTYFFVVSAGALPTGLTLNSVSGAITGTPTAPGTFNFTVTAADAVTACNGSRPFSIVIVAPAIPVPPIPTLGEFGIWILMALLGGVGLFASRRS